MSLSKPLHPLLSTGSTEGLSGHDWKMVDWDVKNQNKHQFVKLSFSNST